MNIFHKLFFILLSLSNMILGNAGSLKDSKSNIEAKHCIWFLNIRKKSVLQS